MGSHTPIGPSGSWQRAPMAEQSEGTGGSVNDSIEHAPAARAAARRRRCEKLQITGRSLALSGVEPKRGRELEPKALAPPGTDA